MQIRNLKILGPNTLTIGYIVHHRDGIRSSTKIHLGPGKTERENLVWFGEIERKLAKLLMTTFTYRSSS
jgi:hypothetical protein